MEAVKYVTITLLCLCFSSIISPLVLWTSRRLHASQSILHYVDKHKSKEGTPTFGGLIFVLTMFVAACFLNSENRFLAYFALAITLSYAILGFLDDFLKVHFHHNEGLRAYQKIIGQVGVACIVAIYLYLSNLTTVHFFSLEFDISWGIIPLSIFVLLATTNSVNLTDGLDGLAGGVTLVYLAFFGALLALSGQANLAIMSYGMCGALLGFLCINCFPAKIFMGDTGSLALGGFVGIVALLSGLEFYIPLLGIMFVLSALSDIIQVLHFKHTRTRIFLMAPLHHHFEQKGVHENRIVVVYITVTTAVCLATLAGVLAAGI